MFKHFDVIYSKLVSLLRKPIHVITLGQKEIDSDGIKVDGIKLKQINQPQLTLLYLMSAQRVPLNVIADNLISWLM